MLTPASIIAIIGFGDMGRSLAVQFARRGGIVRAWDREAEGEPMQQRIEAAGADPASTLAEALRGARLVIVAVADAPGELMPALARLLTSGQVCLDLGARQTPPDMVTLIERNGAHYVAGQSGNPLRLAGARAAVLAAALDAMGCPAVALARLPPWDVAEIPDLQARDAAVPLRRGALP